MKLLFLAGTLRSGGAERQLRVLAGGLAGLGHDVTVAAVFPEGVHWEGLRQEGKVALRSLHHRRATSKLGVLVQLLRAPQRLRTLVDDLGPDVVHSYLEIPNVIAGRALGRPGDPPVVWGARNAGGRESAQVRWARRWGARLSRRIPMMICNSEAGRRHYTSMGYRPLAWEVVPNGIDTTMFSLDRAAGATLRRDWLGGAGGPLVGIVGRLTPVKDHGCFLEAAGILKASRPDLRFVALGDGPVAGELSDRARGLGVADVVHWAGEVNDMPAGYNALDLVVLSSAWGEGFPNALGEALACGVPCVSTDVGDAAAIVDDVGRVVPVRDPAALAAAMARALDASGPTPQELRRRVEERYGLDGLVARTESLLASLSGGRAVGGTEGAE